MSITAFHSIDDDDSAIDDLLLLASQEYEYKETMRLTEGVKMSAAPEEHRAMPYPYMPVPSSSYASVSSEITGDKSRNFTHFASPKNSRDVEEVRKSAILNGQREHGTFGQSIAWRRCHQRNWKRDAKLASMNVAAMNYWLTKFILEVRSSNSDEYSPDSLYQICCGLHRSLKDNKQSEVNIFVDAEFAEFRSVLDGQLKALNRKGKYINKRRASVITTEMEERLWESGLLGDHNPKVLVNTLVYLIGLNFALQSGEEHITQAKLIL